MWDDRFALHSIGKRGPLIAVDDEQYEPPTGDLNSLGASTDIPSPSRVYNYPSVGRTTSPPTRDAADMSLS